MTIRFAPTKDLSRMQSELDRLFDGLFTGTARDEDAGPSWSPRADLKDSESAYILILDVPGMSKNDIQINFHEGVLTVTGERQTDNSEESDKYVRTERHMGRFYRSFTLPKQVGDKDINANYSAGVLKITIPKSVELQPRKIEIK